MKTRIEAMIDQFQALHHGRPWIGVSFSRVFEGVSEEDFFKHPISGMHSMAEILSHLNFWKADALIKMELGRGRSLDSDPRNWLSSEDLRQQGMHGIKNQFEKTQALFLEKLEALDDGFFERSYFDQDFGQNYPNAFFLDGLLQHDCYHLGQLSLLKKRLQSLGRDD